MKNTCILIFVFIFIIQNIEAQNKQAKIDSLTKLIPKSNSEEKANIYEALYKINISRKVDLARLYLDSMRIEADKCKTQLIKGKLLRNEGRYQARIQNYTAAEDSTKKSVELFKKIGNKSELSHSYNDLGVTQRFLRKYKNALENHLKSLKLREELGISSKRLAKNYASIGVIHAKLSNFETAREYFKKSEKIYTELKDDRWLALTWHKIGVSYKTSGYYNEALLYYKKAYEIHKKLKIDTDLFLTTNNLGNLYKEIDSLALSEKFLRLSLNHAKNAKRKGDIVIAYGNLGRLYLEQKKYSKALAHLKKSLTLNKEINRLESEMQNRISLALVYENLKKYKLANENRKIHFKIYDSIFNKEKVKQIEELEIKYQTEKKEAAIALQEAEIKTLSAKTKNDKLTKTLYGTGMLSFLMISGLLYFGFKQRIKKNKIEREKQEAIYKQEIDFKKKELASQTLHLVQKNTFIQELKENLEKIRKSPELFKIEFRRLVMLLKKESAEDKDWEVFKSYFSEVHNNFDQKIKAIYKDISEKEMRLASFLRMNLSTKEIASMLNVLPDSVLKSKYRLKKKLNLDKEMDLNNFLKNL